MGLLRQGLEERSGVSKVGYVNVSSLEGKGNPSPKCPETNLYYLWFRNYLGGGFKYFWNFHPYLGKISNWTSIFFRWVGSTTNQIFGRLQGTNIFTASFCGTSNGGTIAWG